jgi:hypothetical protein
MEFGWRVEGVYVQSHIFVMFGSSGWMRELRGRWDEFGGTRGWETNAAQKHEHAWKTPKCDPIVSGQPGNVLHIQLLPKHTVPFFSQHVFPAVFFLTSSLFSLLSNSQLPNYKETSNDPISTNHLPHCTLVKLYFWLPNFY